MTKEQLRPLGDRVVIRLDEVKSEQTSESGLILMANATPAPQNQGTVVITGPGRVLENGSNIPVSVHTGDRVIFNMHAGTKVSHNEEEFLIMHEGEIIAVV